MSALGSASYHRDRQCHQYEKAAPGSVELSVLFPVKTIITGLTHDCRINYLSIYIYRYNDSSALVTSTASIPPRIMVIQCDSTSTRFCSLFAVETTINQHISTLPQHFPELPTNLWKCGFAWKALRVAIFSSAVTRYISELPSGKRLHNYGKSPCYSWLNQLFLWPFPIGKLTKNDGQSPL